MDNRLDLYSSDEYGDEVEENRKANSTKWLKSSNVSLANLQQVKPVSVYNFGISNQKDLKATNLSSQRSNSFNNLVAEPVLQSVGSQKTAWGSNGCIPDLLKPGQRPGSAKPGSRPGSAKSSARKYHPPTGKKTRPQSAKEDGVKHTSPSIAVKGAKFDPTGRPPKSFAATTGWIGPPAGMKFAETRPGSARSSLSGKTPPPPTGTPTGTPTDTPTLHIDVDLQSSTTEDDNISPRLRYTHAEPQRTPTPPHVPPAPIHLMLPSMYDDAEEDEDEDELDTERLLQMADQHIHADKKSECINDFIEKVSSANHLPGFPYTHINGQSSQESKLEIHADGGSEVVSWEKEDINNSADFSDYGSSGSNNSTPRSDSEQNNHPHLLEKISVKFSEDKNVTIDITPRNTGHKVSELTRKKPLNKLDKDTELQSFLSVSSANACESPVSSRNNNTVSLTEMKHDNKSVSTLPNKKSYTRSERPKNENLEFKFTSQENAQCDRNHGNKHVSVTSNRPTTPVSSITVAYCDLDDAKKQKRCRGLKKDRDVVTLVQQVQVSDSDDENQEDITPDKLESWMPTKTTSQPSKNYYELSRQAAKLNGNVMRKEKIDPQLIGGAPLVKTIKTIELAESGNDLKETKTQSFIDKQVSAFGEKDKQQREATRVRTRPRPTSEMLNRNAVKNEKEANSKTELDQKVESSQKKRPFSAPRRRPSSAIKEKKEKDKNKITEESLTDITSTPKNENPDVTYIIQADNTNGQEFVAMETEEDKMSDLDISQDSVTDEENYIEEPAMTDKDIEIEKIIERHLGKPSQTLSYPSQEEEISLKSNKKQSKSSSTQKKFTAHSHSQCNCPLRSYITALSFIDGRNRRTREKTSVNKSDSKKVSTVTMQLQNDDKEDKISNKVYGEYARRKSAPPLRQITKSKPAERPRTAKPVYITSKNPDDDFETEENIECQKLQARLAANGVNVKAETLERALYPPAGRTKYYEINARLPQHSSTNLLSHPREWLPIEYRQLKLAEKALNRANEMMYKQRMAEDRKARLTELAKKKVKGKKKGKTKGKKTEEAGGPKNKSL